MSVLWISSLISAALCSFSVGYIPVIWRICFRSSWAEINSSFFSEIIPKTIGANYWRSLAIVSGVIIQVMIIITYPLVIMTGYITRLFAKKGEELSVSREELSAMVKIGRHEGILKEKENRIIQNIIRLNKVKVSEIMTPRVVVIMADENMSLEEFFKNKEFLYYSRIPVYSETRENITGYVIRQKVFEKLAAKEKNLTLKDLRRNIVVGNEFQTLLNLWEEILEKKEHIAIIVDEYGGLGGIVTMDDIIETILGLEIVDEYDRITDMQQYALERWNERKAKYNMLLDNE